MIVAAAAVSLALLAFFAVQYVLFSEDLARKTLESESAAIANALAAGKNPASWDRYTRYSRAYAYRVFDKNQPKDKRLLSQANPDLLPPMPQLPADAAEQDDPVLKLEEGFGPMPGANTNTGHGWLQVSRESVGGRGYWVQLAMLSDPAWVQRFALGDELLSHVLVPVAFIVPALTLAMLLTTQRALRPLTRIAEQARTLGIAASSGFALTPLSVPPLPREFADVFGALNAMLARMDRVLARQRQFASDAAHELRTPLSVLRLQLAALPPSDAVALMDEEVAALAHLIGQLLRFAQAEEVMARDRRPVDIVSTVRDTCAELAPLALARRQELEFVAPPDGLVLPSHPELLGVVVRNLVENAMRASPAGTTITIVVEPNGNVVVEDEGPGVPEAQRDVIFERLWRADRQRKDGAGIGLALVRRIAQLHGGDVSVESRPGGGARFLVCLQPSPAINDIAKMKFS